MLLLSGSLGSWAYPVTNCLVVLVVWARDAKPKCELTADLESLQGEGQRFDLTLPPWVLKRSELVP